VKNEKLKVKNFMKCFAAILLFAVSMPIFAQKNMKIASVLQASKSPIITFRIQFLKGSLFDPQGKEGVADLTASMLSQGGSQKMSYDEIVAKFYPMAAGFSSQVDKEMTTFVGQIHKDKLGEYYEIIRQMLLEPGFRDEDFTRIKQNSIDFLKTNLRESNDEELGKERLYNIIYRGTGYEHHSVGTVSSLEKLTIQDVKDFYRKHYTQPALVIGLAGGFDKNFPAQMQKDFSKLREYETQIDGDEFRTNLSDGMKIDIVQRETRATAISMGFPIEVNRRHKDYPALALVASYFGQHRSSSSYLYGRIRELRGLNYGDYAYIEYFPRGMFQFEPDPNLGRMSQIFQIWIRPVEPQNANFTLRAALYEYDKLIKNGIDQKTFEETRAFLMKYVNILTQTKDSELGYALDSRYYRIGNFNEYMKTSLSKLTLADVNAAIKKHLTSNKMRVVMVTKDAEGLKKEIVENKPGMISYASPKPADVLAEDKIIGTFPIPVKAADITITSVDKVFQ